MARLGVPGIWLLASLLHVTQGSGPEQRTCWFTSRTVDKLSVQHVDSGAEEGDEVEYGGSSSGGGRIQGPNETCSRASNSCYALWKEDVQGNGSVLIIAQGCWESSSKQDCEQAECVTNRRPPKALNHTNFCCCSGNLCNGNVSQLYQEQSEQQPAPTQVVEQYEEQHVLIVSVVVVIVILTVTSLLICRRIRSKRLDSGLESFPDSVHLMENGLVHNSHFAFDNMKLEALIGQGRYGSVWRGLVGEQSVAVKVFPACHRNYFYNELDIYSLPFMVHPSLLSFYGSDERTTLEGHPEFLLFLSVAPNGCLQDFLRENILDWATFLKMALTVARGVAYLHTDIHKGDKVKPCICHRDLNSRNILVKEDLSCVLCDLGFATKMNGSKYYYNGEEQHAETKSISDVGTLRYMSPEVLEGAVNLRDCETSLKQIDVYALGLVLWELSSRCGDLYPSGIECQPYKLPFEAEIGHPTYEQMQVLVCRHKARPLFPDLWRDSAAMRTVKETIEDCWDQDAEARLTALCVEERFNELCGLADRQHAGQHGHGMSPTARCSLLQKESNNVLSLYKEDKEADSCLSESTMDTLLTISPSNPLPICKNSNQLQGLCPSLQPYQGRNPCLERNLARDCDSSSGELVDKSHKHLVPCSPEPSSIVSEYLNLLSYSTHSEPVARPNLPIPFLQNVYSDPQPGTKLSNVPRSTPKKMRWLNIKRRIFGTQADCGVRSQLIVNETSSNTPLSTPTCEGKLETQVALSNGRTHIKLAESKLSKILKMAKPEEEEIVLLGTQNNKRPNTLQIHRQEDELNKDHIKKRYSLTVRADKKEDRTSKTKSLSEVEELSDLRRANELRTDEAFNTNYQIPNGANGGSHNSLVLPPAVSKCKTLEKTLAIKDIQNKGEGARRLKDPTSRVKTPGDMPLAVRRARGERNSARFSLYDDRIMSGMYDDSSLYCTQPPSEQFFNSFEDIHFTQNI